MVSLRHLLVGKTTSIFLCIALGLFIAEVNCTKIAYKKSIDGKVNIIKVKAVKPKSENNENHDKTTTTTTPPTEIVLKAPSDATPTIFENLEVAESVREIKTLKNNEEDPEIANNEPNAVEQLEQHIEVALNTADLNTEDQITTSTNISPKEIKEAEEAVETVVELPVNDIEVDHIVVNETVAIERIQDENTADPVEVQTTSIENTTHLTTESTEVQATTPSKRPTPCTCGIFMTSQIKRSKNPYDAPKGQPVISNELDRTFPCNAVGQKQCQTKCLEAIVQHLPNSANILCATLDRDIRKERAYLYIKNCRNQWYNTNLAAGREYCCKNNQPYQCPLV